MFRKKVGSHAKAGGLAYPSISPDIFSRLQPEIDAACDEMVNSGVKIPTREMVEQTTRRIYDNVCRKYPDMANFARVYDRSFPAVQGGTVQMFGVEIQQGGAFFGLLAFLFLAGFFFRRGRFNRRDRFFR